MKRFILSTLCFFILLSSSKGQWAQTDGPYGQVIINDLEKTNSTLFAATNKGVFTKGDSDSSWVRHFPDRATSMSRSGDSVFTSPYHYLGVIDATSSTPIATSFPYQGYPLINSPSLASKDSLLFITSNEGIFISDDFGTSKLLFNNGLDLDTMSTGSTTRYFIGISHVMTTSSYLYCSTSKGIYRSDYTFTQWEQIATSPSGYTYEGANALYALIADTIHRSTDHGDTWTAIYWQYPQSVCELNGDIYVAGLQGVVKSTDNGLNWTTMNTGLNTQWVSRLESLDGELYSVEQLGNLHKWDGNQWSPVSSKGMISSTMRGIETTSSAVFALDVNKGVFRYNHDNTWSNVSPFFPGKMYYFQDLRSHDDTVYTMVHTTDTANNDQQSLEMCFTHDDGQSWSCSAGPTPSNGSTTALSGLFKLINGSFYFFNNQLVLRSNSASGPWEDISPIYTNSCPGNIYDLNLFNNNLYITGCDLNTLRRYDENQQTWVWETNFFQAGSEANLLMPRDTFLYVSTFNGLYRRSQNVSSYTKMTSLDTIPVYASDYLNIGKSMYVTAGKDLYRSTDEGQNWTALRDSLPDNWGTVDVGAYNDTLFLALYDYGVFKHPLLQDPISINEVNAENLDVSIFPNPAKDWVTVTLTQAETDASFSVNDQSGKLLLFGELNENGKINTSSLAKGNYVLSLQTSSGIKTTKLIIAE